MGRAPAPGRAREAAVHPGGLAAPRSVPAHTWDVGTSTWSGQGLLLLLPAPAAAGDSEVPGGGPAQRPQPVRARPGVQAQPEGGSTSSGSVGLVCTSQPSSGVRVGPTSQSCGEMAASLARAAGWHPATTRPRGFPNLFWVYWDLLILVTQCPGLRAASKPTWDRVLGDSSSWASGHQERLRAPCWARRPPGPPRGSQAARCRHCIPGHHGSLSPGSQVQAGRPVSGKGARGRDQAAV